jgi:transposase
MEPGASVAEVARAHGLNANQVFKWRRAFERGELTEPCAALLPVKVSSLTEPQIEPAEQLPEKQAMTSGSIHIELPGRAVDLPHFSQPLITGVSRFCFGCEYI